MFKDFTTFNAAERKLTFDKSFETLASVLSVAMGLKGTVRRLPQRYRRGYANIQTLVVNKDTGEVMDQTSNERQSALAEYFTEVSGACELAKARLAELGERFQRETCGQGAITVAERFKLYNLADGHAMLAVESAGAILMIHIRKTNDNIGFIIEHLYVACRNRALQQVTQWATGEFAVVPLYMPNRGWTGTDSESSEPVSGYLRYTASEDTESNAGLYTYTLVYKERFFIALRTRAETQIWEAEDDSGWAQLLGERTGPTGFEDAMEDFVGISGIQLNGRIDFNIHLNVDITSEPETPILMSDTWAYLRSSFYNDQVIDDVKSAVDSLI